MKKFDDAFIHFDKIHERDRQTDGRRDGRTPHDGIGRVYAQHRATKKVQNGAVVPQGRPHKAKCAVFFSYFSSIVKFGAFFIGSMYRVIDTFK